MNKHHIIKKIQVISPSGLRTGGPESLHNLVRQINRLDITCELVYFPFFSQYSITTGYERYVSLASDIDDTESTLIIIPETLCMIGFLIKNAQVAIWWLSVDNFLQIKYHSSRDYLRYLRLSLRRHRPFFGVRSLKHFIHFSKSKYDEEFLDSNSIPYIRLTGPISDDFIDHVPDHCQRHNVILFNPKKGHRITKQLIHHFPDFVFKPLENLNNQELISVFSSAKIYIDFGNHPGKERMPREAALMGCCLITGLLGSAKNPQDIPIPAQFKIDPNSVDFLKIFKNRVIDIFNDYHSISMNFSEYRHEIRHEPFRQIDDLSIIFKHLNISRSIKQ